MKRAIFILSALLLVSVSVNTYLLTKTDPDLHESHKAELEEMAKRHAYEMDAQRDKTRLAEEYASQAEKAYQTASQELQDALKTHKSEKESLIRRANESSKEMRVVFIEVIGLNPEDVSLQDTALRLEKPGVIQAIDYVIGLQGEVLDLNLQIPKAIAQIRTEEVAPAILKTATCEEHLLACQHSNQVCKSDKEHMKRVITATKSDVVTAWAAGVPAGIAAGILAVVVYDASDGKMDMKAR